MHNNWFIPIESKKEIEKMSEKILNTKCFACNEMFNHSTKEVCICLPCEHLCHIDEKCNWTTTCLICDTTIKKRKKIEQLNKKNPRYADLLSVYRPPLIYSYKDYCRGFYRLVLLFPFLVEFAIRVLFNWVTLSYLQCLTKKVFSILRIHINVVNKFKFKEQTDKRILIANHTSLYDGLIIGLSLSPYICFVASKEITKYLIGRNIMKNTRHLILEKNKSGFDQIKEFVDAEPDNTQILIFPEGFLSGTHTLARFRSTAFLLDHPIQPLVIHYKQDVARMRGLDFLWQPKINVTLTVMDTILPQHPVYEKEIIRKNMAIVGKFHLSRVEHR